MEIAIEKGVPLPQYSRYVKTYVPKYPFSKMEVGDSFFIIAEYNDKKSLKKLQHILIANAHHFNKKNDPKWKFITRTQEQGIRIWRLK